MTAKPDWLPEAFGQWRVVRPLGRGGMGLVFEAEHTRTGARAALKTVRVPDAGLLQRIRREVHALARLRHPGIVRILDEGAERGMPWYAMEMLEGATLDQRARARASASGGGGEDGATSALGGTLSAPGASTAGDPASNASGPNTLSFPPAPDPSVAGMVPRPGVLRRTLTPDDLKWIVTLVRRVCSALAYLHGEGLVHRDLKPSNVLLRADERPVLADFGLISAFGGELSREQVELDIAGSGTVWYMPPEQIRGELVDARADLYAVGCILFELLTGQPPFTGFTAAAVMEAHKSTRAEPPSRLCAGIPPELDRAVVKLLEKDPRDRFGYALDLGAVLEDLGAGPEDEGLPVPRLYLYRPGLVGRSEALSRLEAMLVPGKSPPVTLVGGESGVGKTRVVMELARRAALRGVHVLIGEALQDGSRPLEVLRKPLQAIADRCRERGPAETERLLGKDLRLLGRYEPSLAALADQSNAPEPPELAPDAARERLFAALLSTLTALAADLPALVILDDVQWADELSLAFLRDLAHRDRGKLIVVAAYRTEEVRRGLDALIAHEGTLRIPLQRLPQDEVRSVVGDMLAMTDPPDALVELVAKHSEGNPFFVGEYLRSAVRRGLLRRDRAGQWRIEQELEQEEVAAKTFEMPETLRELVRRRLVDLAPLTHRVVETAAVIGRDSELDLIGEVMAVEDELELLEMTNELIERQVLEDRHGKMRFLHDKIREAVYFDTSEEQRRALHQRVAEVLDARPAGPRAQTYAVAQHYARGETAKTPRRLFETCAAAGAMALEDNAPEEAYGYFVEAQKAATSIGVVPDTSFAARFGEACLRSGRLAEAETHLRRGIARSSDPVQRAELRTRLASALLTDFASHHAWKVCDEAFEDLGAPYKGWAHGVPKTASYWVRAMAALRRERPKPDRDEQRRLEALASVYQMAQSAAYYEMNALDMVQLSLRALYPATRIGVTRHAVEAYASYGVGLASIGLNDQGETYVSRAVETAEQLGDPQVIAKSHVYRALATSMGGRSVPAVALMRKALEEHGKWLDAADYIAAAGDMSWNLMMRGYAREAWEAQGLLRKRLVRTSLGDRSLLDDHTALSQQLLILAMLGRESEAAEYLARARKRAAAHPDHRFHAAFLNSNLVAYYHEQGELGPPLEEAIATYRRISPSPRQTLYHLRGFWVLQAYARLAQLEQKKGGSEQELDRAVKELSQAALMPIFKGHLRVLEGAQARLRGKHARAAEVLDEAERIAHQIDAPWILYEVLRERALLARDTGDRAGAEALFASARRVAATHEWPHRVAWIDAARGSS